MADPTMADGLHRELFCDERGTGMRATWHPDRGLVVLSIWRGDTCAGTFRLSESEAVRLGDWLLQAPVGDQQLAGVGGMTGTSDPV